MVRDRSWSDLDEAGLSRQGLRSEQIHHVGGHVPPVEVRKSLDYVAREWTLKQLVVALKRVLGYGLVVLDDAQAA